VRSLTATTLLTIVAFCSACSSSKEDDHDSACTPDDADGIVSEPANPLLTVTDSGFTPKLVTVQNTSDITLTLENRGTRPHGFVVDCLPTPNSDGCPAVSCFPSEARIDALDAGDSATIRFESPLVEGIYIFHSSAPGDDELASGQLIVQ
jgi:hypothetical protein